MLKLLSILISVIFIEFVKGKVFSKCELASELIDVYNETINDATKFLCLAEVSGYNTQHSKNGSFGIFNISNEQSKICNISSSLLLDNDVEDDLNCARKLQLFEMTNSTCANFTFNDCEFFNKTDLTEEIEDIFDETTTPAFEDINDRVSTSLEPKQVTQASGVNKLIKEESTSRQDNSKQILNPESLSKFLLVHNFAVQHPKPNVNLIFVFI